MKRKTLLISGAIVATIAITVVGFFLLKDWYQSVYREGETTTTADGNTIAQATDPVPSQSGKSGTIDGIIGSDIAKPFELVPADIDDNGTGVDSGYHIILKDNKYNVDELSSKMSISPETAFTVEKKAENDYVLTPSASLTPNKIYSFAFNDEEKGMSYSWAFQTRKAFNITATLPRNEATHVPVNTGIEITFSQKDLNDLSGYFEISPQVSGRFEIHKNVIAFVPSSKLSYDTIYTVTVKKGFGNKNNNLKLQEETAFMFQTEPEPALASSGYSCNTVEFVRSMYNLYPYEIPNISVYSNMDSSNNVEFSLYKYNSADEFKRDISVRDDRPYWCSSYGKQPDIEGKEQTLKINTTLKSFDESNDNYYYRTRYVVLPEALPEGYYIAVIKVDGLERRAYIQVNSMAVYVGTSVNKTIAFIYDSESALPVEGAKVVFNDFTLQTGQDGLAVSNDVAFNGRGYHTKNYEIVRDGHPTYFSSVSGSNYQENTRDKYWSYLFTDRAMYLPSDTINIWGLVTGRDSGTAPGSLTVKLSSGYSYDYYDYYEYYDYYGYNAYAEIDSKEVTLTGPDTFQTSMTFENLNEGYYSLRVYSGDVIILSKGIRIQKYTKPLYTIKTSLDKEVVFADEKLEFNLEAGFFEGTPVNGMKFNYYISNYYYGSQSQSGVLKTDAGGRAKLEFTPAQSKAKTWYPYTMSVSVSNVDPEESPINEYEMFHVFPRDTMLKISSETDEADKCTVTLNTNKIDISKIRYKSWYSEKDYTGEKTDIDMTVELYEEYYTATKIGTFYDFINKVTYPRYKYESHTSKVQTLQLHSLEGTAAFSFTKEDRKGYFIKVFCNDGGGNPIEETYHVYDAYYRDENTSWLKIDYYSLKSDKSSYTGYSAGEKVNLTLYRNNEPCVKQDNTKVLFMRFRKGMLDHTLTDETTYSFDFKKEYIPNAAAMAIYFDGKSMQQTYVETIRYREEDSSLNIEVVPSASEYKPGGTASFNVKVTDSSGKGRRAQVLFSVVDEAYFALYNQNVDILGGIYSYNVSSGYTGGSIPYTNTLKDYNYYGAAECGEGGDDVSPSVRSDFKDTALFKTIMTDENGHGELSFKLPDNLTKWRVTCQGLTDDLCAGDKVINIDTRLPYFISTVFNEVFITGDKPV
ncbi:MAG: Ig-like domain-containing protein, partial [Eubacteriales bacterium]|nr:Ig-like domain-containing protein [Eubacteriales bacterium]